MMEFRTLRPEELDAWAGHCGQVFGGAGHDADNAYFLGHYRNDPWRDIDGIFVAVDGGVIASTVRLFRRRVWLLGCEAAAGGIGEVSTKPEYRGRGLAGRLLEMALEKMRREGVAVSLLFSLYHDFYGRYGWEPLPKPLARYARADALPCEGRALRPEDLPVLMAVEQASEKTDWSVVRSAEYWESWISREIGRAAVATEGGDVAAWLAYEASREEWRAVEFRALPGREHLFSGLCALAAELEGRRGQGFVAPAWLPSCGGPAEKIVSMHAMARLVCPFAAGGARIGTTRELLEAAGECRDSELDHF